MLACLTYSLFLLLIWSLLLAVITTHRLAGLTIGCIVSVGIFAYTREKAFSARRALLNNAEYITSDEASELLRKAQLRQTDGATVSELSSELQQLVHTQSAQRAIQELRRQRHDMRKQLRAKLSASASRDSALQHCCAKVGLSKHRVQSLSTSSDGAPGDNGATMKDVADTFATLAQVEHSISVLHAMRVRGAALYRVWLLAHTRADIALDEVCDGARVCLTALLWYQAMGIICCF